MDDYKKALGERLRQQRKLQCLTQEQLAERLDISIKPKADYPVPIRMIEIYQNCPEPKQKYLLEILELEAKMFS